MIYGKYFSLFRLYDGEEATKYFYREIIVLYFIAD